MCYNKNKKEKGGVFVKILEEYASDGIALLHSIDETPKDGSFQLHIHDYYELFCFVSGKASYMVEGNIYELRPGTVMIMRSSETHKLIVDGSEKYERYILTFYPEALRLKGLDNCLLDPFTKRMVGEKNIYNISDFENFRILDLIVKTCNECRELTAQNALYCNLASILCSINCAFKKYYDNKGYSGERDIGRELLNYINDNLTEELSINRICNYIHLSPTQLGRRFKELTGTTVYQYILSKRLIMAQRYIAKGRSAAEAAQKSGFGDYSCFYRMYKKRFGYAPTDGKKTIEKL